MSEPVMEMVKSEEQVVSPLRMYAILDSKAEAFMIPFFAKTDGVAIRMIDEAVNGSNKELALHAEDYTLYAIAVMDEFSGEMYSDGPRKMIEVSALKKEV